MASDGVVVGAAAAAVRCCCWVEVAAAARWAVGRAAGWRGPVRLHVMLVQLRVVLILFRSPPRSFSGGRRADESESTASFLERTPPLPREKGVVGRGRGRVELLVGGYGGRRHDEVVDERAMRAVSRAIDRDAAANG